MGPHILAMLKTLRHCILNATCSGPHVQTMLMTPRNSILDGICGGSAISVDVSDTSERPGPARGALPGPILAWAQACAFNARLGSARPGPRPGGRWLGLWKSQGGGVWRLGGPNKGPAPGG